MSRCGHRCALPNERGVEERETKERSSALSSESRKMGYLCVRVCVCPLFPIGHTKLLCAD